MNKSMTCPRPEYPRPDFRRKHWQNLNGEWEFSFDDDNCGEKECWYLGNTSFHQKIVVPFCYQSEMSGIGLGNRELHEYMWYRRNFDLKEEMRGGRVLLCFGAVDTVAKVWLNGVFLGKHEGGYTPFSFDITDVVQEKENLLIVKAEDSYECSKPRGKQYWGSMPDRCWYTPVSGIWQSVWVEAVGKAYVKSCRLTPDLDRKCMEAEFYFNEIYGRTEIGLEVFYQNKPVKQIRTSVNRRNVKITIDVREEDYVDETHYWTPENPNLYDLTISVYEDGRLSDFVETYFGMRKISISGGLILLNNRPYYQKLILDQGYWKKSILTPPSEEALKEDILAAKKMGFNGARKHQKIEDPYYYYWADKLGLLVWGEMPSGYAFDVEEAESIAKEWMAFIERDYNHPCIVMWVPLNESWGVRNIYMNKRQQDFGEALYALTKALDGTRPVSTNDGWEQVKSDICGIHDYAGDGESFRKRYANLSGLLEADAQGRMLYAKDCRYAGEPILITEYGGIAFEDNREANWGYNTPAGTEEEFLDRFRDITGAIQDMPKVCGYCYTQLTDVEQEVNGLLTVDREWKVNPEAVKKINEKGFA